MLLPSAASKTNLINPSLVWFCSSRRRLLSFCFALLTVSALHPAIFHAQDPADDEVVKVNTNLLVFPIRVRDKRGPAATTLTERDLLLKDEDHVTRGLYFYPGADRVSLIFALDQSGSLREMISQQREAALALFSKFGDRSRVAIIRFAEKPSLIAPFGRDTSAAREAFNFPVAVNQHTAIFDAAAAAVSAFERLPRVRSERRIVILISDGLDNASTIKAGSVIEAAFQRQISFYVIHLPLFEPRDGRLAVRTPAKGFRELAEKTGGKYFLVGDSRSALAPQTNSANNDLTPVFRAIEEDLRSQYLLGFYIGEGSRDGRKHRFTLSVPSGVEYQVGRYGYSRTHEFFDVNPPSASPRAP
ncbi:MAG: VWA domain-containing protein [Acidobacteriota bacterium]|nr:VWA domain-containing protein [Acidobacteriota bacterium]